MAQSVVVFTHSEADADAKRILQGPRTAPFAAADNVQKYLGALASGVRKAKMEVKTAMTYASGTITFSGTGAANDTILINGVTFTAKASGATGNEWNVGASATLSAAALAAAINASATALVNTTVTAAAASGVVTITAKVAGYLGNAVTIAEGVDSGSAMTVSGARLTGGDDGTVTTSYHGGAS